MKLEKVFADSVSQIQLGPAPIHWTKQLNSTINTETFLLDFYRGSFELSKFTVNKRYRQTIILFRYDNAGRHTNPDGTTFEGPHVHLYREGFNDKFAFPASEVGASGTDTMEAVFIKILQYCNVTTFPDIKLSIF